MKMYVRKTRLHHRFNRTGSALASGQQNQLGNSINVSVKRKSDSSQHRPEEPVQVKRRRHEERKRNQWNTSLKISVETKKRYEGKREVRNKEEKKNITSQRRRKSINANRSDYMWLGGHGSSRKRKKRSRISRRWPSESTV